MLKNVKIWCFLWRMTLMVMFQILIRLNPLQAQDYEHEIDSLIAGKQPLEQITLLNELSVSNRYSNVLKAKYYALRALKISEKENNQKKIADALKNLGAANQLAGNYDSAILNYRESATKYKLVNDLKGISGTLNNLGVIFLDRNQYDSANVYFKESLEIKIHQKDSTGISRTLMNIGTISLYKGNWEEAFHNFETARNINLAIQNKEGVMNCDINIGIIYRDLKDLERARFYTEKAYQISVELKDKYSQAICLNNLGDFNFRMKKYEEANNYFSEAFLLREEIQDQSGMITSLINISKIYETNGNYFRANEIYIQALKIAYDLGEFMKIADIFSSMSFNLRQQSDFLKALEYTRKSLDISREITSRPQVLMNLKDMVFLYSALYQIDSSEVYLDQYILLQDSLNIDTGELLALNESTSSNAENASEKDSGILAKTLFVNQGFLMVFITVLIVLVFVLLAIILVLSRKLTKKQRR